MKNLIAGQSSLVYVPGLRFVSQYEIALQFGEHGHRSLRVAAGRAPTGRCAPTIPIRRSNSADPFPLLRKPRHKAGATTIWTPTGQLTVATTLLYVSGWRDILRSNSSVHIQQPGYTVVNIAVDYVVTQNVTAFARVDNLFNQHYQVPNGFQQTGFGIYGGVRLASR